MGSGIGEAFGEGSAAGLLIGSGSVVGHCVPGPFSSNYRYLRIVTWTLSPSTSTSARGAHTVTPGSSRLMAEPDADPVRDARRLRCFGVTGERVRHIENAAVDRLRSSHGLRGLLVSLAREAGES